MSSTRSRHRRQRAAGLPSGGRTQIAGIPDEVETFAPVNQYGLQAEAFSRAVRNGDASAFPLEDALLNMRVLDAVFRSAQSGRWEDV